MLLEHWGQKQTENQMDHRLCHHGPVEEGACGNGVRIDCYYIKTIKL